MVLKARRKEVKLWVHLDSPNLLGSEMVAERGPLMDSTESLGRPPNSLLRPRTQADAALLRAASSLRKQSPGTYHLSLSAHGTRMYDFIKRPREEIQSSQESSPLSLGRIQYPKLQKSAATTFTSELRLSKLVRPNSCDSYSSLQQRSPVKLFLRRRSASAVEPVAITKGSSNNGIIPPAPSPPPRPLRARYSPFSALKKLASQSECDTNGRNLLHKEMIDSWDRLFFEGANTDVTVYTNDYGYELVAHSTVLMCSSPVLKCTLQEQFGTSARRAVLNIRGVPSQAVRCFVRFLYSSRCEQDDMEKFALHLLVLAHAYMVPSLKRVCTDSYEHGLLNLDNVVDVLQIARLCDASRLHLLCFRRIVSDFKTVARSDGWRIMKESNPALEQELVEAVIEAETKRQDRVRKLDEDKAYGHLHDAMEALVHICRDGCRSINDPNGKPVDGRRAPDCPVPACKSLEYLVRHFAACKLKVSGGCVHCERIWQLLELHSRMCTSQQPCKVPLCRHFTERKQQATRKEEMRWKMLVQKVQAAKAASGAFSLAPVSSQLCVY